MAKAQYPIRAWDHEGNEIYPEAVRFRLTGGSIDIGDHAVPSPRDRVQGTWSGFVKGGKMVRDNSVWVLEMSVAVEDSTVVVVPGEMGFPEEATAPAAKRGRGGKGKGKAKGSGVAALPIAGGKPQPHAFLAGDGDDAEGDPSCAVEGCGLARSSAVHTEAAGA